MPEYKVQQLDNQHFSDKIALRNAILDEAKFSELHVLDLFAGAGHIWTEMGKAYKIASYLPVDVKPRLPGTLKLDVNASSVTAFRPDSFNTVDIDCYDSKGWELLPHFVAGTKPLAIFLTYGSIDPHSLSRFLCQAVGMPASWRAEFHSAALCFYCGEQFLRQQLTKRFRTIKFLRYKNVFGGERVRYYGILLGGAE